MREKTNLVILFNKKFKEMYKESYIKKINK